MDSSIWTINGYFNPKNAVKTPLKEQWIFFYSEKKENNIPDRYPENKQTYPENKQTYDQPY